MANIQIKGSFPYFLDLDGEPLESGFIYIGTAGLAPESNQITVYYDEALTQPAAQPLITRGGYMIDQNGSPCAVYTSATDYSLKVADKNNVNITYELNLADPAYSESGSVEGRVTTLEGFVDQDVKVNSTPVFGSGTKAGDTGIYDDRIEINIDGTGDRNSYIDFQAADLPADYNSRIIRNSGQNGNFDFIHRGTGAFRLDCVDGGDFQINAGLYDSDLSVFGTSAGQGFFWDASAASVGVNDSTPSYNLDVNGTGRFTSGLQATTLDNTNSIDGAAIQSGTIPQEALAGDAAGEQYGVYRNATLAATTNPQTDLIGTRIDVTDPAYSASSFEFKGRMFFRVWQTSFDDVLSCDFTVKKNSGGEPFVSFQWGNEAANISVYWGNGALSSSGVIASSTHPNTSVICNFERVDNSNELCFRIDIGTVGNSAWEYYIDMSGTKFYTGTNTGSEGTAY